MKIFSPKKILHGQIQKKILSVEQKNVNSTHNKVWLRKFGGYMQTKGRGHDIF